MTAAGMILVSNVNYNIEYSSLKKCMYTSAEIVYREAVIIVRIACMESVRLWNIPTCIEESSWNMLPLSWTGLHVLPA
jgi:hypothetical protein